MSPSWGRSSTYEGGCCHHRGGKEKTAEILGKGVHGFDPVRGGMIKIRFVMLYHNKSSREKSSLGMSAPVSDMSISDFYRPEIMHFAPVF
ncbi:hypothetical protein ACQ0MK_03250 [Thalassospira lucentensis]|uniref:hypothetical protein n=1 Tax=Thalassospira lucentensis TaxID=168935 RepID=UPI003D2F06E2